MLLWLTNETKCEHAQSHSPTILLAVVAECIVTVVVVGPSAATVLVRVFLAVETKFGLDSAVLMAVIALGSVLIAASIVTFGADIKCIAVAPFVHFVLVHIVLKWLHHLLLKKVMARQRALISHVRVHTSIVDTFPGESLRDISPADVSHAVWKPILPHTKGFFVIVEAPSIVVEVWVFAAVDAVLRARVSLMEIACFFFFIVTHLDVKWLHHLAL